MSSFLKEVENNFHVLNITNGEIVELFKFHPDITDNFVQLLHQANPLYKEMCTYKGKSADGISEIWIKKDKSGKCYMEVVGNDNRTRIILTQDDVKQEDYYTVRGYKISETGFAEKVETYQQEKLKAANISKRFLKEEIEPIDLCEEMYGERLIKYYQYLRTCLESSTTIETFDEPENMIGAREKAYNTAAPRVNPVVDYIIRKQELMKHNPTDIITFKGNKTGREYDTFIYERDGYVLAIAEPLSGVEYQYDLNLGMIDLKNKDLIKGMVKAALEASEEVVMLDDAIMRKNHTTMDVFSKNIDMFLNGTSGKQSFKNKIEQAKEVYGRAK